MFDKSIFSSNALVIVIVILYFKGITHLIYKKYQQHNKQRFPLLNLLIECILARSAAYILSIKDECTFHFFKFSKN